MDALARLEPVARPLIRAVDRLLATLGAPPEHPVWALLRQVGATPADALAAIADLEPARPRATAATVGGRAGDLADAAVPVDVEWLGVASRSYAARAAALDAHQRADGPDSLAGRLRATAGYLDDVAEWQQRSRDRLARALADVMTSCQAVALRLPEPAAPDTLAVPAGLLDSGPAVLAAADISARLLREVAGALDDGDELRDRWAPRLAELVFHPPAELPVEVGGAGSDTTIEVRH